MKLYNELTSIISDTKYHEKNNKAEIIYYTCDNEKSMTIKTTKRKIPVIMELSKRGIEKKITND